jgi:4-hydroxy-3-polyprenylbenzoate decarboxylase
VVIEGLISTEYLEPEGPFGESHGYVHPRRYNPFMEVTAITHRPNAILVSFISQVTPSESSAIKRSAYEALFLRHLRDSVGIKSVVRVLMHEPLTNLRRVIVIQMKNPRKPDVWRALHSAIGFHEGVGKIVIAIDEDIDPENADAILWALSYRMKPHKDVEIVGGLIKGHGPPFGGASLTEDMATEEEAAEESALLIDATLKEPFPPISLPKREYMERARKIWEELGFPALRPQAPWFGYSLGQWDEELEKEALLAADSDYWLTGEKIANERRKVNL